MIGGLLIDAIVIGAIVAFEWAGPQLGAANAVRRAVACAVGFLAAVVMRDPVGGIIDAVLGTSVDLSRLVAMLGVGVGAYLAASKVLQWRDARRAERVFSGDFDSEEFGSPVIAAVDGALLGFCWAVLFISFLVLLPADNVVSRSAVQSFTGSTLIKQEGWLRWLSGGFPHYTQTLPKGEDGAVVGERESLPMHGDDEPRIVNGDVDIVLRLVNGARRDQSRQTLAFNPDLAAVARRHATSLVVDRTLTYRTPTGGALEDRARAALGGAAGDFQDDVGIEVAWAHSAANATKAMLEDGRAGRLLLDERWTEVGIGVADGGWFNGRIYVLLLVGPVQDDDTEAVDSGEADDTATGAAEAATEEEPFDEQCPGPFDLDGDGTPDEASVDPACLER